MLEADRSETEALAVGLSDDGLIGGTRGGQAGVRTGGGDIGGVAAIAGISVKNLSG